MSHGEVDNPTKANILAHDGVTMVGESESDGQRILVISVTPGSGYTEADFPVEVQGLPVVVEEREMPMDFSAVTFDQSNRDNVRPLEAGLSTSVAGGGATGTYSLPMTDGDQTYVSSNYHVWSSADTGQISEVFQPGAGDGGTSEDVIGRATGFKPKVDGGTVDLAWGPAADGVDIEAYIHGVGEINGTKAPEPGDPVVKSGRSSGVTRSEIDQVGVTTGVSDLGIMMHDQVLTADNFSELGDSGSPVMMDDDSGRVVGVVWGGASSSSALCHIDNWESESGLEVMTQGSEGTEEPPLGISLTNKLLLVAVAFFVIGVAQS